jgi:ubiquitin-protein ligase
VPVVELDNHFQFEIFLDTQYPFSPPQVFCYTRFTNVIDLYDGKNIYLEVMRNEEWRVANNLHEIITGFGDFIEQTKFVEDEAIEQHDFNNVKNYFG